MEGGAAARQAPGEERRQALRRSGLRALEQKALERVVLDQAARKRAARKWADPEWEERRQMEQVREPGWLRDHPKTREQLVAQEQTKAGDTRARAHRPPEAAPPSAEDRTPIERRETLRGEPLANLGHDCRRV